MMRRQKLFFSINVNVAYNSNGVELSNNIITYFFSDRLCGEGCDLRRNLLECGLYPFKSPSQQFLLLPHGEG
jgi:hypothetical protein